jgi:hypothetical protein
MLTRHYPCHDAQIRTLLASGILQTLNDVHDSLLFIYAFTSYVKQGIQLEYCNRDLLFLQ